MNVRTRKTLHDTESSRAIFAKKKFFSLVCTKTQTVLYCEKITLRRKSGPLFILQKTLEDSNMHVPRGHSFSYELGQRNSNFHSPVRISTASKKGIRTFIFIFRFPTTLINGIGTSIFVFSFSHDFGKV